mgnify:CR=1 FL=1
MSAVTIAGAGAFGTALALVLARAGAEVTLLARDAARARAIRAAGRNSLRLPGHSLPAELVVTADGAALSAPIVLLAVPAQRLGGFLRAHRPALAGAGALVACAKGIDAETGLGPAGLIAAALPGACPALLSGPGFADEIAAGLPTALTLACADEARGVALQRALSGPALRLYRTRDIAGVELGGALKNVIAIAAGLLIGRGLGESARAALLTRGFAEMIRLAEARGGQARTLAGLSGLGDLMLTAMSDRSRNFRHGRALGAGAAPDAGVTVEGVATAAAVMRLAGERGIEMPINSEVAAITAGTRGVGEAVTALMSRPLRAE